MLPFDCEMHAFAYAVSKVTLTRMVRLEGGSEQEVGRIVQQEDKHMQLSQCAVRRADSHDA